MLAQKLRDAFGCFQQGDLAGAERLCDQVLKKAPANADALHLLGVMQLMGGRIGEAVKLLARACDSKRDDLPMLENLGLAYLSNREFSNAELVLRRALGLGASHGLLYMRLGLSLAAQGTTAAAIEMLREAARRAPSDPDVHLNMGNTLFEAGDTPAAEASFQRVLTLQPTHLDARFNLGTLYLRLKRTAEAEAAFQQVIKLAPQYADAHASLGLLYAGAGRSAEAVSAYERALALDPGHIQALNNLGNTLFSEGRHADAVGRYEEARALHPQHPDAYIHLGNVAFEQFDFALAKNWYERALAVDSRCVDAYRNLGRMQQTGGARTEALDYFRRAAALAPHDADVCLDLGGAYRDLGAFVEAIAAYRQAMSLDPLQATPPYELAETLKMLGRFDEAIACYEQAIAIKPDHFSALGALIYVRQLTCAWDGIEALWAQSHREAIGVAGSGITPFSILSQPTTPQEQLACAAAWAAQNLKAYAASRSRLGFDFASRPREGGRLRIGYLSWDYHQHATSYLIAELFELHDRDRFEIFAYSYGPDDGSEIRGRLRAASDHFVDLAASSHADAARAIYRDGIDILVDLKGYTMGARPQIMALRPAPVQVNWLGFPGSMGTDCIDYILADAFVIPPGADDGYSEKVVRLPGCYQINDRHRKISEVVPGREAAGLPRDGVVFCCFNQANKILPDVFASWMRLLAAVPHSVLWLLQSNAWAVENLRRYAGQHGIAPERVIFAPVAPLAEHLARYRLADLALDTFPYTSHTTGSDALWVGCPLITCVGSTFASRVAGSLLLNAGLPELVVDTSEAYEKLALDLASHPERLQGLRSRLANNRESCALFDAPRFVRNLEAAYLQMRHAGNEAA